MSDRGVGCHAHDKRGHGTRQRITLTERLGDVFRFIRDSIKLGIVPTVREIEAHFGSKSPNSVIFHL